MALEEAVEGVCATATGLAERAKKDLEGRPVAVAWLTTCLEEEGVVVRKTR